MKKIAIYGAGGFGREVAWLAETCGSYNLMCLVDDNPKWQGKNINTMPVKKLDDTKKKYPGIGMVVAVGSPKTRQYITEKVIDLGFNIVSIVHPRTEMSRWIDLNKGVVICAGCILTTNIFIGKYVQINLDCTVGHDVVIGDYTTLAPGVHVSGWVHFGQRVYIGTGAVLINGTEKSPLIIGDDAVIGAGACVTKSIPPGETWVGVPAKKLK
jgi:sugar O-acyltransferase (sialic acid O-acetyltransferase NeuD family)